MIKTHHQVFAFALSLVALISNAASQEPISVTLANDEWPPFILPAGEKGMAHELVCEALERSGHDCSLNVDVWDEVLRKARVGEVDGIAAAWRNAEREAYLLFSKPYLTNRIMPVTRAQEGVTVSSVEDLVGLRVAMVTDYAYGDEIEAVAAGFETVAASGSDAAIAHVREGRADVALVDELVARERLQSAAAEDLMVLSSVLAYRSLHFAMSRKHPDAEEILADFHRAYEAMLLDGTVNEILDVDWLATDFGQTGTISVVMRSGLSLEELALPAESGSTYALEQPEHDWLAGRTSEPMDVQFKARGQTYASVEAALDDVFGRQSLCTHREYSSIIDCTSPGHQ